MATTTGGTTANNSLTSLVFASAGLLPADVATIAQAILDDQYGLNAGVPARVVPGAFSQQGLLFIPNRGLVKVLPGDVVMVDPASGWPVLVSAKAISVAGSVWNS
jgi:hypothetical protein